MESNIRVLTTEKWMSCYIHHIKNTQTNEFATIRTNNKLLSCVYPLAYIESKHTGKRIKWFTCH